MIGFLQHLTERLRAHNETQREQRRQRAQGTGQKSLWDERYEEYEAKMNEPKPPPSTDLGSPYIQAPSGNREELVDRLKSGRSKIQKRINAFVPFVTAILTMLMMRTNTWPAGPLREFLADLGIHNNFALFVPLGIIMMIPVAIIAAILVSILARKYE